MDIKRAYRFRFYPAPGQETILVRTFGCARFAYNHMLRLRSDAWYQRQERVGYHETSAALTAQGADLGLTHFAILSTGEKIAAPKTFRKREDKPAKLQRRLAKKQTGSANRRKAKLKVARLHAKIADARRDFLHKLSTRLVDGNRVIAIESLAVSNLQKTRSLSKSIRDASWCEFVRQLTYKAGWYGRTLTGIDRWYPSSKRRSDCGHTVVKMPLNVRDRDVNAARNVLAAGLAVSANGESVNPMSP